MHCKRLIPLSHLDSRNSNLMIKWQGGFDEGACHSSDIHSGARHSCSTQLACSTSSQVDIQSQSGTMLQAVRAGHST